MRPENRPGRGFEIALVCLGIVALILTAAHHQADEYRDELRALRQQRNHAEEQARKREEQLDGALAKIQQLSPPDSAPDA